MQEESIHLSNGWIPGKKEIKEIREGICTAACRQGAPLASCLLLDCQRKLCHGLGSGVPKSPSALCCGSWWARATGRCRWRCSAWASTPHVSRLLSSTSRLLPGFTARLPRRKSARPRCLWLGHPSRTSDGTIHGKPISPFCGPPQGCWRSRWVLDCCWLCSAGSWCEKLGLDRTAWNNSPEGWGWSR